MVVLPNDPFFTADIEAAQHVEQRGILRHAGEVPVGRPFVVGLVVPFGGIVLRNRLAPGDAAFAKILSRLEGDGGDADLREGEVVRPVEAAALGMRVGREGVGWEFLQMLKMEDATSTIPVLICTTAVRLAQDIGGYLATKRVAILRKPFESRDLVEAVKSALLNGESTTSAMTKATNLSKARGVDSK